MKCAQAKSLFSPYLDGAVSGTEMRTLDHHLQYCGTCLQDFALLCKTQQLLVRTGRRKAPEDLALRLRVAISGEVARARRPYFSGIATRLENLLNAFMVPATAGLFAAVTIFAMLMGSMTIPAQANSGDVPLLFNTAPEVQQSLFRVTMDSINEDSLVIEAYVDSNGRVQDYRILSDPGGTKELLPKVKNMLIFTTFRPATFMGQPTSGRAVLSFSKISVKG
jgi:anti-sigma factor RsiW